MVLEELCNFPSITTRWFWTKKEMLVNCFEAYCQQNRTAYYSTMFHKECFAVLEHNTYIFVSWVDIKPNCTTTLPNEKRKANECVFPSHLSLWPQSNKAFFAWFSWSFLCFPLPYWLLQSREVPRHIIGPIFLEIKWQQPPLQGLGSVLFFLNSLEILETWHRGVRRKTEVGDISFFGLMIAIWLIYSQRAMAIFVFIGYETQIIFTRFSK